MNENGRIQKKKNEERKYTKKTLKNNTINSQYNTLKNLWLIGDKAVHHNHAITCADFWKPPIL